MAPSLYKVLKEIFQWQPNVTLILNLINAKKKKSTKLLLFVSCLKIDYLV